MMTRALRLWLCVGWLMNLFSEAVSMPNIATICDLGPCACTRGKLLCDCSNSKIQDICLTEDVLDSFTFSSIVVTNCAGVNVTSNALRSLPALMQVSIANVARLTLEERAFNWRTDHPHHSGLLVNITNSAIPALPSYCFQGSLREILLSSVNVSHVHSYAISSINQAEKIEFNRVSFSNIEPQSFKKFSVKFFNIFDSYFYLITRNAVLDIEVLEETRLERVKIDRMELSAFKMRSVRNFRMIQCKIGYIEQGAFHVHTRGDVSIHDNVFYHLEEGAFLGFTVESKYLEEAGKQDLVFENNTLVDFEGESLNFNTTGLSPRLDWVMINQSCSCVSTGSWTTDLVYFTSGSSSKVLAPNVDKVIYCLNPKPTTVKDYQSRFCEIPVSSIILKCVVALGVALALSTLCVVVYCKFKKKGKRYINVPTSPAALKPAETHKPHMLVVPDGKTYRETELHVIVEHAEPIIPTEFVKERPDRNDG